MGDKVKNIYVLDTGAVLCARAHCDKDLGLAAYTYVEVLSSAHMNNGGITNDKHVLVRWAMNDKAWCWLGRLVLACLDEQMYRFGEEDEDARSLLRSFTHEDDGFEWQQGLPRFVQLVKYKVIGNPVAAYRGHYIRRRAYASWTRRGPPEWWDNASYQLALPSLVTSN